MILEDDVFSDLQAGPTRGASILHGRSGFGAYYPVVADLLKS
jgi:hypothetical protein